MAAVVPTDLAERIMGQSHHPALESADQISNPHSFRFYLMDRNHSIEINCSGHCSVHLVV